MGWVCLCHGVECAWVITLALCCAACVGVLDTRMLEMCPRCSIVREMTPLILHVCLAVCPRHGMRLCIRWVAHCVFVAAICRTVSLWAALSILRSVWAALSVLYLYGNPRFTELGAYISAMGLCFFAPYTPAPSQWSTLYYTFSWLLSPLRWSFMMVGGSEYASTSAMHSTISCMFASAHCYMSSAVLVWSRCMCSCAHW